LSAKGRPNGQEYTPNRTLNRYAREMARRKVKYKNVTQTRVAFSAVVEESDTGGEDTIVTKNGTGRVILLNLDEWRRLRAAAGEPTDA
jgi:PHD/YefM family antitoxin component YafN of YafNO toxin-antitoxin module